jgi:hypothetical protein
MNIWVPGSQHPSPNMLSITREHSSPDMPVTRIIPLPNPAMPVSRGIDIIVSELQAYDVNAAYLHQTAQQLDSITTYASNALRHGDMAGVHHSLEEAVNTMREAIIILKLLCIIERNQLPGYVLEHLILTRELIQKAMNEASTALNQAAFGYSSTA